MRACSGLELGGEAGDRVERPVERGEEGAHVLDAPEPAGEALGQIVGEGAGVEEAPADLVGQGHGHLDGHGVADGGGEVVLVVVLPGGYVRAEGRVVPHVPLVAVAGEGAISRHLQPVEEDPLALPPLPVHGPQPAEDAGAQLRVVQVEPVVVAWNVDAPELDARRRRLALAPDRGQRLGVDAEDLREDPAGAVGHRGCQRPVGGRPRRAPGPLREGHRGPVRVLDPALGAEEIDDVAEEHQVDVRGLVAGPRHLRGHLVDLVEREREDLGRHVALGGGAVAEMEIGDEREHGSPPGALPSSYHRAASASRLVRSPMLRGFSLCRRTRSARSWRWC